MAAWYEIEHVSEIDSPSLLIYRQRVKRNIQRVIEEAGDVWRLRPHVKTHKSPEVTQLMLDGGISRFKCATIAEAEMLAMSGARDILIAYQLNEPKIERFVNLIKKYGNHFSCLFDNEETLKLYARIAVSAGISIAVYIDLNVGMNRTGIAPGENAIRLYKEATHLEGVEIRGLHAYDGQLHIEDFDERTEACNEEFSYVEKMVKRLNEGGFQDIKIVAGGSPSFPIHAKRKAVELSPGTFVFWDWGYHKLLPEQPFEFAALVLTRVISIPSNGVICVDLGHKSVASENVLEKRVHFLNAPELKPISQSEEHLVLQSDNAHPFKVGDVLYGVPYHICPTCALYERSAVIENNRLAGEWHILARDRKLSV